ncbi:hypothetical protein JZ751_005700 [Albula glossodonta]|uniref:G-protein coupled receptors family 1 profile domain-containing protein n=1 Tax=Albula glossodonta TaxID=121402 RepID=A0A8T2MY41_9TELE|nr:hypothetical protein JZ751_005700 [Albula glossodonta]
MKAYSHTKVLMGSFCWRSREERGRSQKRLRNLQPLVLPWFSVSLFLLLSALISDLLSPQNPMEELPTPRMESNPFCSGWDAEKVQCNCSISEFKHQIYPPTYLLIFTLGLLGNLCSLGVFVSLCRKKGLTSVNLYLVNLLVSDLMLVCALPFRATYYLMDSHWVFGDITCRLISYAFYINTYGSVYFLVALSVMRYLAVVRPHRYVRLQTSRGARAICALIWLFVALVSAPMLTAGVEEDAATGKIQCLELTSEDVETLVLMNQASMVLSFLVPFFIISFCYVFVVHSLLRQRDAQGSKRPCYRKSCALVIIVIAIFLICYLPYHVVRTVFLEAEREVRINGYGDSCGYIAQVRKAAVITLCLATGNSCLDPVLFFFVGENFREFLRRIKCREEYRVEKGRGRREQDQPRTELLREGDEDSRHPKVMRTDL